MLIPAQKAIIILNRDVRGMKNSREFLFPFPEFPGIMGMGIENLKTCIIPEIPYSPGMGMNFLWESREYDKLSKFGFLKKIY